MLTQERLKELLHYDPETGVFTRLVKTSRNTRLGVVENKPSSNNGYMRMKVDSGDPDNNNGGYFGHRLAWLYVYGYFPPEHMDHINHDRADNRIANLREVTHQENLKNMSMNPANTSGVTGVGWVRSRKTWSAIISVNGKNKRLGSFQNKEDAIAAREAAEIKYGFHENHGKELFDSGEQLVYNQRCHNGKTQQQHEKGKQHEFRF